MKNVFQVAIATASAALSLAAVAVKPAQAATFFWDLNFFEDNGVQVGSGQFSYSDDIPTFVPVSGVFLNEYTGFYTTNALRSFSANIDGVQWGGGGTSAGDRSFSTGWNPSGPVETFGVVSPGRGGIFTSFSSTWFSGFSNPFGTRILNITSNPSSGGRRWGQLISDPPRGFISGGGPFTATLRSVEMTDLGFTIYTERSAWEDAVNALGAAFTTETFDNNLPNARDLTSFSFGPIVERGDVRNEITFDNGVISTAEESGTLFVNEIGNGVYRGTIDTDNDFVRFARLPEKYSESITWEFPSPVIGFGADWFRVGPDDPLTISGNDDPLTISGNFDGDTQNGDETVYLYAELPTLKNQYGGLVGEGSGFLGIVSPGTFSQVTLRSQVSRDALYAKENFEVDNLSLATVQTPTPVPEPGSILALVAFSLTGLATSKKLKSTRQS